MICDRKNQKISSFQRFGHTVEFLTNFGGWGWVLIIEFINSILGKFDNVMDMLWLYIDLRQISHDHKSSSIHSFSMRSHAAGTRSGRSDIWILPQNQ